MKKLNPQDYEEMESSIERIVDTDMVIKVNRGYIFEVRKIEIGDSESFYFGDKVLSLKPTTRRINVKDILENEKYNLLTNGDQIAYKIISAINNEVDEVVERNQIQGKLKDFKGSVKIVIDNNVLIKDENVEIKYAIAMIN